MLEAGPTPREGAPSVSEAWAPSRHDDDDALAAPALSASSDDDEPYVCYFVEKRAMMHTCVGTLWNPPGRSRRRDPPPPISSETGRPVAPGGLDDSVLDDRCASHGCVTRHLADLLARDPSRDPADVSAFVADRACVRRVPRDDASASRDGRHRPPTTRRASERPDPTSNRNRNRSRTFAFAAERLYRPARANPLPLAELAARALGDALRFTPNLPDHLPPHAVDVALGRAVLDRRILAMTLAAGAARLHVHDFERLARSDVPVVWRCWIEGVSDPPAPPPERSTPVPLSYARVGDEGFACPSESRDWLRDALSTATGLRAWALEAGDEGDEGEETRASLRAAIEALAGAGGARRVSIAFFDCVDDATLAPLWPADPNAKKTRTTPRGAGQKGQKATRGGGFRGTKRTTSRDTVALAPATAPKVPPLASASVPFAPPLARLTRLDLSHLPNVTDASVVSAVENLPSLTKLRLEFLPVTDACLGAGRGGWRAFLRNLTWLEIKSCPYVRFAHPAVDFKHPPPRLATLRVQPGGEPARAANAGGGVNGGKPKGGRADMSVSARHLYQLAYAKRSPITHLCLGCKFAGAVGERSKLGVRGNLGGYRSEDLLDFRVARLDTVEHLELYRTETQVAWPAKFADWTRALTSLVVETPSDGVIRRLRGVQTLRRLHVCDCDDMPAEDFEAAGMLGPGLETLVMGGVRPALEKLAGGVVAALAPGLREAHFHRCPEYPNRESVFD